MLAPIKYLILIIDNIFNIICHQKEKQIKRRIPMMMTMMILKSTNLNKLKKYRSNKSKNKIHLQRNKNQTNQMQKNPNQVKVINKKRVQNKHNKSKNNPRAVKKRRIKRMR
jgi:hypothetical protein